jgi:serine/threonine protein kinase
MESFLREAHTMAALQHPNVVFIYGVVNDGERLGIVEEFMSSGSLRRLLNLHQRDVEKEKERELARMTEGEGEAGESPTLALASAQPPAAAAAKERPSKNVLGAKLRARCALDVARGMAYLHSKRFVHFDLKCDNVLTARRGAKLQCKVCDFGLSKRRRSHASFVSGVNSHRGTLPWTAPELLNAPTRASEKVDVYSFAVLMWELWTGAYPYAGMHEQTIMCGIMMRSLRPDVADGENPAGSPVNGWKALMFEAWRDKPEERPSFEEIVKRLEGMLKASEGVP